MCNVLISLVELSVTTWVVLLVVLTVFFYFATMEVSLDNDTGLPITGFIFFEGGCIIALAFGVLLKFKMDAIFYLMMHDPEMMTPLDQSMRKTDTGETPGRFQVRVKRGTPRRLASLVANAALF